MGRKGTSLNLLTLLALTSTGCAALVIALFFLFPSLAPAFRRLPTQAVAFVGPTGAPTEVLYPTLPPAWTEAPSPSPTTAPTTDPNVTPVVAGVTPLPDLAATAQTGADARVAANADHLRLRIAPGTSGQILAFLAALTPLDIVGRTPDNSWLEVITPEQKRGWVLAEFLEIFVSLQGVPLTAGAALDVTPTAIQGGEARVSETGLNLRVRASPGTAGTITGHLQPQMVIDLLGRTGDNVWLEMVAEDGQHGWVMEQYVDVFIDLAQLPITGQAVNAAPPPATMTNAPATQVAFQPTSTSTSTNPPPTPTATQPPPPTLTPTSPPPPPTPTSPPPPGGFQNVGYLSGLSQHTRDIYVYGQALGNRRGVFSKVGDSITIASQFLFPIGSGQYNLRDYGYLGEAVAFFSSTWARTGNSFYNTSLAAKSGWSSWSVLAPSLSDKNLCGANELPLLCEYRLTRPAVALIMVGTNDVMGTDPAAFRANLERVVDDSVARGVIPVLSTIPAFLRAGYEARADELDGIIMHVRDKDVPAWNYWAAMQPLPNRGLGADGVHPSWAPNPADFTADNLLYGYTVRNLTALQVLDALWRQVMY